MDFCAADFDGEAELSELNRYRKQFAQMGLQAWHDTLNAAIDDLRAKIGTSAPTFVDSIVPLSPSQPPPATINVTGQTGVGFQITIVNPQNAKPLSVGVARARITKAPNAPLTPLFHNLNSAIDTNFNSQSSVTDYGVTSQTSVNIAGSGLTLFWRIRSSFDGKNWNSWKIFAGPTGPIAVSV
jgi:hypothetical protein